MFTEMPRFEKSLNIDLWDRMGEFRRPVQKSSLDPVPGGQCVRPSVQTYLLGLWGGAEGF